MHADAAFRVVEESLLTKTYAFQDFADALAFVNRVGAIAEREGHHPEVHLAWSKVKLEIWTQNVNGLTENDFIFAAKADEALGSGISLGDSQRPDAKVEGACREDGHSLRTAVCL